MSDGFAPTPEPPYYAVMFTNQINPAPDGYDQMAARMVELALAADGCLGAESARNETGFGITISYWSDADSIAAWKADSQHLIAQKWGIEKWYSHFELRVAKVERAYSGPEGRPAASPTDYRPE